MPTIRRAIFSSFLVTDPKLLEPISMISVSVPARWVGGVNSSITRKRGRIVSTSHKETLLVVDGHMPVAETSGLTVDLRSATSGHAFWQSLFEHWEKVPENIGAQIITENKEEKRLNTKSTKGKQVHRRILKLKIKTEKTQSCFLDSLSSSGTVSLSSRPKKKKFGGP